MNFRLFRPIVCRPWLWPYIVVAISNEMVGCCCDWPWILKLFTRWLIYIATTHGNSKQEVWPAEGCTSFTNQLWVIPFTHRSAHLSILHRAAHPSVWYVAAAFLISCISLIPRYPSSSESFTFITSSVPLFSLFIQPFWFGNSGLAIRIEFC